jgi:hypothetical protein
VYACVHVCAHGVAHGTDGGVIRSRSSHSASMAGMRCLGNASRIAASTAAMAMLSQRRLNRICGKRFPARRARMSPLAAIADESGDGDGDGDESGDESGDGDGAPMLLSPEERAKLSLRDLDNRLAALSQRPIYTPADPPRVTYMTGKLQSPSPSPFLSPSPSSSSVLLCCATCLSSICTVSNMSVLHLHC